MLVCRLPLSSPVLAPAAPQMSSRGRSQARPEPPLLCGDSPGEFVLQSLYKGKERIHSDKDSSALRMLEEHIFKDLYFYKQGDWDQDWLLRVTQPSNTKSGNRGYVALGSLGRAAFQVWWTWVWILLPSLFPPPSYLNSHHRNMWPRASYLTFLSLFH